MWHLNKIWHGISFQEKKCGSIWPHTFFTSYALVQFCIFWQQYPKCCDWYFNDLLTPSLPILTQMNDSDRSFPSLKIVSLSVSTELILSFALDSQHHLRYELFKLMPLVVAWLLLLFIIYTVLLLFVRLQRKSDPWPWGASVLLMSKHRRGVKQEPEVRGGDVCGKGECECR